jgi:hypothetical protein
VLHNWVRRLYSVQIKGKAEHIAVFELVWRQSADLTAIASVDVVKRDPYPVLRLRYGDKKLVLRPRSDALVIGRTLAVTFRLPRQGLHVSTAPLSDISTILS